MVHRGQIEQKVGRKRNATVLPLWGDSRPLEKTRLARPTHPRNLIPSGKTSTQSFQVLLAASLGPRACESALPVSRHNEPRRRGTFPPPPTAARCPPATASRQPRGSPAAGDADPPASALAKRFALITAALRRGSLSCCRSRPAKRRRGAAALSSARRCGSSHCTHDSTAGQKRTHQEEQRPGRSVVVVRACGVVLASLAPTDPAVLPGGGWRGDADRCSSRRQGGRRAARRGCRARSNGCGCSGGGCAALGAAGPAAGDPGRGRGCGGASDRPRRDGTARCPRGPLLRRTGGATLPIRGCSCNNLRLPKCLPGRRSPRCPGGVARRRRRNRHPSRRSGEARADALQRRRREERKVVERRGELPRLVETPEMRRSA